VQIAKNADVSPQLFNDTASNNRNDTSVGIATRCGLDGTGIESRWGARFSGPVQAGPGAHAASYTMDTGSFPGVKRPEGGVDHPPPSSAEVKERVELYLYSHLGLRGLLEDDLYLFLYQIISISEVRMQLKSVLSTLARMYIQKKTPRRIHLKEESHKQ